LTRSIRDWSSDVCSSDLHAGRILHQCGLSAAVVGKDGSIGGQPALVQNPACVLSVKPEPAVGPWVLSVGSVVGGVAWTDEKSLSGVQIVAMSAAEKLTSAAADIVKQIVRAHSRSKGVTWAAPFPSAQIEGQGIASGLIAAAQRFKVGLAVLLAVGGSGRHRGFLLWDDLRKV